MFKWLKPTPKYKIEYYPDLGYMPFYREFGIWWAIKYLGVLGVSEDSVLNWPENFFKTEKEAGEALNKHATYGGRKTIWVG